MTQPSEQGIVETARIADKILRDEPNYIPGLVVQGISARAKGEIEEAMRCFYLVLAQYPNFAPAQKELAGLHLLSPTPDLEKAHELAAKAREALPDDPETAKTFGIINYLRDEPEYAALLLNESNQAKPLDATGLFYLGMARSKSGDAPGGTTILMQALEAGLTSTLEDEAKAALEQAAN